MSCLVSTFLSLCPLSHRLSSLLSLQSLDEDCTLEEEDEGLIEEEDEIDQFNDDTFGAGAIGESCLKCTSNVFINCQSGPWAWLCETVYIHYVKMFFFVCVYWKKSQ